MHFKRHKLMIKKGFSHIGVFFLFLFSLLPLNLLYIFSSVLYYIVYYLIAYRKKIVRNNLIKSFPNKTKNQIVEIEKSYYRYFVDLVFEIIKLNNISKKELLKRVKFNGLKDIENYFKNGESVLACTGHYGNWEMCMLALGLNVSAEANVIYKPLNDKVFEQWFQRLRTQYGNIFVPMRQTLRAVVDTKDKPTLFCFASDQTPVREETQYTLQFLNQPTAVFLGLEKIALKTNRPIYYFDVKRLKRGFYEVNILPLCLNPKDTKNHEITDLLFHFLNKTIQREPAFWLWSHRRWKLNN